ncbi:sensor histidine kinase [Blastococcus sp. TF02-8]|uniref:sensor histidine kinase n=1 Tax=Blastococcus sp. TF02-8 TaxID=2250574 RepID=UPI000DE9A2C5|nr:sensor histidine kinase [Blastococcus sp. TF02-8]RBY97698.1 sensor histidine kinase [Blastococcus sp. TF02-8]
MNWTATGGVGYPAPGGFPHDALFHDSTDALIDTVLPFLHDGLAEGDAAVVAVQPRTAALLREALGRDPRVLVVDEDAVYGHRTPAAITTFRRLAKENAPGGAHRVRVVGEIDFGRTARDWLEWERYEAVINEALRGFGLWGVCLFDTARLPGPVLDAAHRTHRQLVTPSSRTPNPQFTDPAEYLRGLPVPDEPLESTPPRFAAGDVADFIGLRHAVASELADLAAPDDLIEDFLLAVDEMTSNALRHGLPPVGLRLWTAPDRIVCSITDGGPGWDDPFAGYGPAHGDDLSRGGMGLWLARQLCDHVDIRGGAHHPGEGGISVRLTVRLP